MKSASNNAPFNRAANMSFARKLFTSQSFWLWLAACALTVYAILRAWLVAPLHDENATFFHYIETGAIWGKGSLLDANNHLLNSYLGRFFYRLFGENYFLFRLPTALSTMLYFWVVWKLTSSFVANWQRYVVTLAIVCIPFVFDYFSYTRGYGLALCFFCCALYFLQRWLITSDYRLLVLLALCLLLSISANLTFLVSALLVVIYAIGVSILRFKELDRRKIGWSLIAAIIFGLGLKPLLLFSFQLRNVGALYYGSLDGFWPVTGKTLCRYVLFYDADWLKPAIGIIAIIIGVLIFVLWRRHRFQPFLQRPEAWGSYLLAGNVVSILFLAKVMHINYPEDRAAMYFIPLTLLVFGAVVGQFNKLKWILLVLLFFPVTFLWQLNLRTSVFTPDQRMCVAFYKEVRNHLRTDDRLCIDPIQQLNWAHFERKYQTNPHFGVADRTFEGNYDVIISNTAFPITESFKHDYKTVAFDPDNGVIAYRKRERAAIIRKMIPVAGYIQPYKGRDEFIELMKTEPGDERFKKQFSLTISGDLVIDTCYRDLQLIVATADTTGQTIRSHSFNLRWYLGEKKLRFHYDFPYTRIPLTAAETELKVYIWNPERRLVRNHNCSVKLNK
ncbi:MAG TPA: hypothetical protein VK151_15065 [Fluviicola sp.]|nr:hypothetical protein [Fluviicola sp.]